MKAIIRELLGRTLPPSAIRSARYRLWLISSYAPRLAAPRSALRAPKVRLFGAESEPAPALARLHQIDALAPTRTCRILTKHGSDKARAHRYGCAYSALFQDLRGRPIRILELGMGSNHPDTPSNMGTLGTPGASLRAWRDLFPRALVYGADVDRRILFEGDRIKTFYCDQSDRASIRGLWAQEELACGADIIIEDGLHTFEANRAFLEESLPHLNPGGIYVAEDIDPDSLERWAPLLREPYRRRFPLCQFAILEIPNRRNRGGVDRMIVAQRARGKDAPDQPPDEH